MNMKHDKKAVLPVDTGIPAVGTGASDYAGCVSACKGKQQVADIGFEVSQGKYDCEAACASGSSFGTGILDKRDSAVDDARLANPLDLPAVPAVGTGAGGYEACLSGCKGRYQSADIVFTVSQGRGSCEAGCASAYGFDTSILDKKDHVVVEGRASRPAPLQSGPSIFTGAEAYDACLSSCNGRYSETGFLLGVSSGSTACKESCAQFSSMGVGIISGRSTPNTEETVEKRQVSPDVPAIGSGASGYDACVYGCEGRFQNAGIVFGVSQGSFSCKSACKSAFESGTGIFDKRQVPTTPTSIPTVPCGCTNKCIKGIDFVAIATCLETCLIGCPDLPRATGSSVTNPTS
ncbi:hypothetical protein GGS20DRAFT_542506 [Poronia punctata]|nr:hypothetical protein GGS20DRAFT_542506 [Poronia punctata]